MKAAFRYDEQIIDTWQIHYLLQERSTILGKLTVTNKRLFFVPQHITHESGGTGFMLEKSAISAVTAEKSLLVKKVLVTMEDGSVYVFSYGMMNVDRIVAAVRTGCGCGWA